MEFEYWWLLVLPLFFVLGWFAARIDLRQLLSESRSVPARYFQGLKFLANREPEQAIQALEAVVKENPHSGDLYFALGILFRQRGELEKAIRMHQALLDRHELAEHERLEARFELAVDYQKMGLFDRAEQQFNHLRETTLEKKALAALLDVYQQQRNWAKAIDMAVELAEASAAQQHEVAQFYCELAQRELNHSRPIEAEDYLRQALSVHQRCVRASMLRGEIAAAQRRWGDAISAWLAIEQQAVDYLPLVAQRLFEAFVEEGRAEEGRAYLVGVLQSHPALDMLETVLRAIRTVDGEAAVTDFLHRRVIEHPEPLAMERLLEARLVAVNEPLHGELLSVRTHLQAAYRRDGHYHCRACGFRAKNHYWHCPACQGWETFNPYRGTDVPH